MNTIIDTIRIGAIEFDLVTSFAEAAASLGEFVADTIEHDPANAKPDQMAAIATQAAHYANNS